MLDLMEKINIVNSLYNEAIKSIIDQQLAAVILKDNKMVIKPCCNTPRNIYRGVCCGSLHAEAHAILNYFGKSLVFNKKKGWCFFPSPRKEELQT